MVTLQAAVPVYERLLAWQKTLGFGSADDYVFLPEQRDRDQALESYGWQFQHVQSQSGVGANASNGQRRTLRRDEHRSATAAAIGLLIH